MRPSCLDWVSGRNDDSLNPGAVDACFEFRLVLGSDLCGYALSCLLDLGLIDMGNVWLLPVANAGLKFRGCYERNTRQ